MAKFLKSIGAEGLFEKVRRSLLFRPDDPQHLHQVLPQREVGREVERIQGFRYPAPGSRTGAKIPTRESEDALYDVKHYTRDSRNVAQENSIYINSGSKPTLLEAKISHEGSPGSKNPAVMQYDPTGLRSTMTATWTELEKAVKQNAEPNHLPRPAWWHEQDAIIEERIKKGLPPAIGKRYAYKTPSNYNDIKW